MNQIEAFPLCWPVGYPRSSHPARARFKNSFARARDLIVSEVKRLGGRDLIISTNVPLKRDGLPYATFARIADIGAAAYFTYEGTQAVMCCDKWDTLEDNVVAIAKSIEAIRSLDRWGVSEILKRTFTGFKTLEEKVSGSSWWQILGVEQRADISQIKESYRKLVVIYHPDKPTGNAEKFIQVQNAYREAIR